MSFTFKLDGIDLSPYVRVAPEDSMDPYGSGWQNPAFSDAAFAEGHPLLNVDVGNREMIFPLFVKGVASGGSAQYAAAALADSPALYWRLGETVGAGTAADASGNGRTGTVGSGVTLGQTGAITGDTDTAAAFNDTTNANIAASYAPFTVGSTLTIEGIFKRTATTNDDALFQSDGANHVYLRIDSGGNTVRFDADSAAGTSVTWAAAWPGTGTFAHWALTISRAANTVELFINGVSQGSIGSVEAFGATPGNFRVGDSAGIAGPTNGTMDEVAIYGSVLSSARILAHYNAIAGTPAVAAKDNLHAVVQQINNAIRNPASSPLRVEWKDSGASNSTFYDVTFARLDPHFNYRLGEHSYADLGLHVWCAPPYGHTATERILATGAASFGAVAVVPVSQPTGDINAMLDVRLNAPARQLGSGAVIAGYAVVPYGYTPEFPGTNVLTVFATMIADPGAPASQFAPYWVSPTSGNVGSTTIKALTDITLPAATPYVGRNRVLALVRTSATAGVGFWAINQANALLGPTQTVTVQSTGSHWVPVDLGVMPVPSQPLGSYTISLAFGIANSAATQRIDISDVIVLPDDQVTALRDITSTASAVASYTFKQTTGETFKYGQITDTIGLRGVNTTRTIIRDMRDSQRGGAPGLPIRASQAVAAFALPQPGNAQILPSVEVRCRDRFTYGR